MNDHPFENAGCVDRKVSRQTDYERIRELETQLTAQAEALATANEQISIMYDAVSGGRVSKPHADYRDVIQLHEQALTTLTQDLDAANERAGQAQAEMARLQALITEHDARVMQPVSGMPYEYPLQLAADLLAAQAETAAMRAIVDMVAEPGAGVYYDGRQICVFTDHCDGERQPHGFVHGDSCPVSLARGLKATAGQHLLDQLACLREVVRAARVLSSLYDVDGHWPEMRNMRAALTALDARPGKPAVTPRDQLLEAECAAPASR